MMTAHGSIEVAVQAMKLGAYDFILKPFEPDHVALAIRKALEHSRLLRGAALVAEERDERYRLIAGKSPLMNQAIEVARKAAASRSTVLLLGESGTGKEIFARGDPRLERAAAGAVHRHQLRAVSRASSWRASCSGTRRARSPGAHRLKKGKLELGHRRHRASRRGRRHLPRPSGQAPPRSSRSATSSASAGRSRSRWTSASSRPPTATWTRRSRRDDSGRTSITGSTSSRSRCRRSASGARTSPTWRGTSSTASPGRRRSCRTEIAPEAHGPPRGLCVAGQRARAGERDRARRWSSAAARRSRAGTCRPASRRRRPTRRARAARIRPRSTRTGGS